MWISARNRLLTAWDDFVSHTASVVPSMRYAPPAPDHFESILRATPAAMVGYVVNVTIGVVAFLDVMNVWELGLWAAVAYATALYVFVRRMRGPFDASRVPSDRSSRRLERRTIVFSLLLGLPWGYLGVRHLGHMPQPAETILISLGVGMAASGAVLLAPIARAAVVYLTIILAPTAFNCFFLLDSFQYGLLGGLAASYWLFLFALTGTTNQLFRGKSMAVEQLTLALNEMHAARSRIEHIALHDSLTGLSNRRAFLHRLNGAIMGSSATGCTSWAVLLLDLDRFKVVNDTFGHKFGDVLLQEVADRLRLCVRPGDLVARLGGDEFSIVAEHVHHIGDAEAIAIRMLEELERPFVIHDHSITVGVSIGIAAPLSPATDSEQIMRCADLALYEAKSAGRNGFKVFELEMQDRMDARSIVEMGLRQATRKGELELYYQPIYELATLRLARFEALIRWRHPTKGILSPAEFLPVAEEIGLINEIGAWVMHEACRQAMSWPADIAVAVNLSPIQVNHTQVVDVVKRALKESRLPPSRLEIEITETALLSDTHQTKQKLEQLKELGCYLSMDDFGTGYSSLSYLATFPLDGIKIDKAFITRFSTRNETAEIMRAMLELAKALNRSTTVEGIETLAQLNAAKSLGATYGQGYYFSRPVPAAEALNLITYPRAVLPAAS